MTKASSPQLDGAGLAWFKVRAYIDKPSSQQLKYMGPIPSLLCADNKHS